ncbi:MAG TPA: DUF4286 family protein [Sphingobacteriaceae bacterium]|nr:DUF4286 family protein [Sphingobacteriaceae bacterium]
MQPFFYTIFLYIRSMLLYNITIIIESDSESAVISKVRNLVSLPEVNQQNQTVRLLKMKDSPHEGGTYSLQVQAGDHAAILHFKEGHLTGLQAELETEYPGKVHYFESIMEYIV